MWENTYYNQIRLYHRSNQLSYHIYNELVYNKFDWIRTARNSADQLRIQGDLKLINNLIVVTISYNHWKMFILFTNHMIVAHLPHQGSLFGNCKLMYLLYKGHFYIGIDPLHMAHLVLLLINFLILKR